MSHFPIDPFTIVELQNPWYDVPEPQDFFEGARRLSTPQEHQLSLRGPVGKVGIAGLAGARTCYREHREASRWFLTSAALCAKTRVLPMELGGSLAGPWWCQPGLPPHLNPLNLGSQTLRLQRITAPFTWNSLISWSQISKIGKGPVGLFARAWQTWIEHEDSKCNRERSILPSLVDQHEIATRAGYGRSIALSFVVSACYLLRSSLCSYLHILSIAIYMHVGLCYRDNYI